MPIRPKDDTTIPTESEADYKLHSHTFRVNVIHDEGPEIA